MAQSKEQASNPLSPRSNEDAILEAIAALGGAPPEAVDGPSGCGGSSRCGGCSGTHGGGCSGTSGGASGGGSYGSAPGARRAASPGRRRKPEGGKPRAPSPFATRGPWRDEKEASTAMSCMACGGKRKSVYIQCVECKRNGVAEYRRALCKACCRSCDTCEVSLCPTCKRDVHVSCRRCRAPCRRSGYTDSCGLGKEVCCACKCSTTKA